MLTFFDFHHSILVLHFAYCKFRTIIFVLAVHTVIMCHVIKQMLIMWSSFSPIINSYTRKHVLVTCVYYLGFSEVINVLWSQEAFRLPMPSFRGRKVMTTLLIIISSIFHLPRCLGGEHARRGTYTQ